MRFWLITLLMVNLGFAAENNAANPKPNENEVTSPEELQTIRKILELPPERLSRMRAALERMERMPPEARKEYAASLEKLENASPEERKKMMKEMRERGGFNGRVLDRYLKSLPPEKATAESARIRALSPEKRTEFIHSLAEKFGSEKGKKEGKETTEEGGKRRRTPEDANKTPENANPLAPTETAPAKPATGA